MRVVYNHLAKPHALLPFSSIVECDGMKNKRIKFEYDRDVDAAYLTLSRGKVRDSEEVQPGLIVDFGLDDEIIGVEILASPGFLRQQKSSANRRLAS